MSEFYQDISSRFGTENVKTIKFNSENPELNTYEFILIELQMRSKVRLLMTNNLSAYNMPVLEKYKGKEHNELYFCLPSYWDLNDFSNENMNWVFTALFRLQKFVVEKNTWFGVGHTIPFSNPMKSISTNMKQSYFFLNNPIFLKNELTPLKKENYSINFLAVVPIFEDEFDYKLGKGTFKFQRKLANQNVTELLDDFRSSVLKSKWRFFGK